MTPCEKLIHQKIAAKGPITVEAFMELALHHPEYGYYTKAPAIGTEGDFITAPEISQMFGEVVGAWCVNMWHQLGSPKKFNLVELGPGRGTLMVDLLRVGYKVEGFLAACNLVLVEKNPTLKEQQEQALTEYSPQWIGEFSKGSLGDAPTLVIANEFFDAFPVQQYTREGNQWFEKHVSLESGKLQFSDIQTDHEPNHYERSPQAGAYFEAVCRQLKKTKGAVLVIDYGYEEGQSHTLQALKNHDYSSPLERIGETDLTAYVNFKTLGEIARTTGLATTSTTTQGRFLSSLGILERSQQLQSQNPLQIPQIMGELMRLTQPQQMGSLFKVLCAYTPKTLSPGGFQ